jgi:hypothetical protein
MGKKRRDEITLVTFKLSFSEFQRRNWFLLLFFPLKVAADWLALLRRVCEALSSNLGLETGSPGRGFCSFTHLTVGKCQDNILN